jgi:hypothetical protein
MNMFFTGSDALPSIGLSEGAVAAHLLIVVSLANPVRDRGATDSGLGTAFVLGIGILRFLGGSALAAIRYRTTSTAGSIWC